MTVELTCLDIWPVWKKQWIAANTESPITFHVSLEKKMSLLDLMTSFVTITECKVHKFTENLFARGAWSPTLGS